jgi:hypothetical protein
MEIDIYFEDDYPFDEEDDDVFGYHDEDDYTEDNFWEDEKYHDESEDDD